MPSLFVAFLLFGTLLLAAPCPVRAQQAPAPAPRVSSLKDGVYRQAGTTMRLQAGEASRLSVPVKMENGLTIRPDGIMVSRDGTRQLLAEGYAITLKGDMVRLSDDMLTALGQQRAKEVAAATATRVPPPGPAALPATLAAEVQRTEQRLALLLQLSDRLAQRTAAAVGPSPAATTLDAKLQEIDSQLRR